MNEAITASDALLAICRQPSVPRVVVFFEPMACSLLEVQQKIDGVQDIEESDFRLDECDMPSSGLSPSGED